jgi:hypothetical protein
MTKNRKSFFDAPSAPQEMKEVAKNLQKETLEDIPSENKKVKKKESAEVKDKLGHLYVSVAHHRQAKIKSTVRGMKLQEYIGWLIENDVVEIE